MNRHNQLNSLKSLNINVIVFASAGDKKQINAIQEIVLILLVTNNDDSYLPSSMANWNNCSFYRPFGLIKLPICLVFRNAICSTPQLYYLIQITILYSFYFTITSKYTGSFLSIVRGKFILHPRPIWNMLYFQSE